MLSQLAGGAESLLPLFPTSTELISKKKIALSAVAARGLCLTLHINAFVIEMVFRGREKEAKSISPSASVTG
jgi:hypothetical protein